MDAPPDDTCDPAVTSWVISAAAPDTDFPLQNLPLGIVRGRDGGAGRCATAIGSQVLDVAACVKDGLLALDPPLATAASAPSLNALLQLGPRAVGTLRRALHSLLRADTTADRSRVARRLVDAGSVACDLPAAIGAFTDFFASVHHAANVMRVRNAEAPLPSNFPFAPMAYHGRASTIVSSGTAVPRPAGPHRRGSSIVYGPTQRLDFEAELGLFVGPSTVHGQPVSVAAARAHIVGLCLLNDWSARDVQAFESQPLGPFLAKSFATTISPWMVTVQALEPFRVSAATRPPEIGAPLPHLVDPGDQAHGAWAVTVDALLTTRTMREMDMAPLRLSRSNARTLFWTPAQLLAHHTSNGCSLQAGDLLGTGTVSGPDRDARACLLEITRGGREPLTLPTGETRTYLHDDDEVVLRAFCTAPGARRIGFGECRGRILPCSL